MADSDSEDPDWITVPEAAKRLGVSKQTAYRLVNAKKLASRQRAIRNRTEVTVASVEALLEGNRSEVTS